MTSAGILFHLTLTIAIIGCSTKKEHPVTRQQDQLHVSGTPEYQENDPMEIEGSLICAHCYALNEQNTGLDHQLPESGFVKDCARQCADLSYPVAVLTDQPIAGTRLWVIQTSSQLFSDYMSKNSEIKGTFVTKGIIEPTGIMVTTEPGRRQILL